MGSALPDWVTPVAWTWIALCLISTAAMAVRLRRAGTPDGAVWLATALYLGPLALLLHARRAEPGAVLPGGAASALAHLVAVPLVVASGVTIAGTDLWVMIAVIAVVAIALLAAYDRVAGSSPLRTALLAAALTVLAFDVGMGAWMVGLHYGDAMPPATTGSFWFLMQIGVVLGLATGWPVAKRFAAAQGTPVRS